MPFDHLVDDLAGVDFHGAIEIHDRALMIAFRIVNMLHYRFDSDEPQHLHVAWGWTQGLVQYRANVRIEE